ncbi:phosphoglycerate mutase [Cellulomonas chitinilytica]|uniref:Phosphoglycerate mutase n=1 Tax=Cellulomonas chitinilytica TaxID=398759 RepID=A0A919P2J8_9CELL|nr:histidine phosphatase family protein [Cellulomonas chitinilytica]GIG20957.1 phosphoglycerate mutase [Cellulomonas chitinilytica]
MTTDSPQDPRRLLLLRHAKSEHPERISDHQRPLSLVGRRQSPRVGAAMTAAGLVPDLVLCSSALRTRQTWELARTTLDADPQVELLDEVYDAGVRSLLELVQAVPADVRTLLVVGHEPTMSQTAATLASPESDATTLARVRVGVPTASWSWLETDGAWSELGPGSAALLRLTLAE